MDSGLSATRLFEESNKEEGFLKSVVPDWVIKYGGAALICGGLGYLWYRNSSFRVYREIKLEEICRLQIKFINKLFLEYYLMGRTISGELFLKILKGEFDEGDPRIKDFVLQAQGKCYEQHIFLLIKSELKNSEKTKLSLFHYNLKLIELFNKINQKEREGIGLTQRETTMNALNSMIYFMCSGNFAQAFSYPDIGNQTDCLDHKECLQIFCDYETQTIRAFIDLFQKMVIDEGCLDLKKREEAFNKLFEERVRDETLLAYTVEKLGAAYAELPEEEKYHPLILFLKTALISPPNAGYTTNELSFFIGGFIFGLETGLEKLMNSSQSFGPYAMKIFKERTMTMLNSPVYQDLLEKAGIKFDPFEG